MNLKSVHLLFALVQVILLCLPGTASAADQPASLKVAVVQLGLEPTLDANRNKIITADLDLSQATRQMALRRREHPLFKEWWDMGVAIHQGKDFPTTKAPELVSSDNSVSPGCWRVCKPSIPKGDYAKCPFRADFTPA